MVVVKMKGVGQLVGEGTYPVSLTKVTEKKTQAGDDMVTFQATISGSGTEWDGRSVFRNFVIKSDPDADISGVLFYLQQTLLAFGADEEDVTADEVDPVKIGKKLIGNRAQSTITHRVDDNDPSKKYLQVQFVEPDL